MRSCPVSCGTSSSSSDINYFIKKRALDVGKYIKVINIYDLSSNTNQYSKMASIKPGSVFHLLRVS